MMVRLKCFVWGAQRLIRNRYCLLALLLLLLAPGVFSQSMPGREVELPQVQSSPEIRHAWKAAVENYPLQATQLDLSVLSDKEQEEIQSLLSDPIKTYVGIGRNVHLTEANWAMVKRQDGFAIWQAQIHSPAALSLKVRFSDFDLGLGMSVKVYGLSGGIGAPVEEYAGRGLGDDGEFWSLAVPGDSVAVEYWLPAELEMRPADFPFKVERISHRFREEGKLSGVNVRLLVPRQSTCGSPVPVCSAKNEVARGVARYYVIRDDGKERQCSGTLLNNGSGSGNRALYFLTAFHCIDGVVRSSEVPKDTFINTEFRFRYDNCTDKSEYIEGRGATFVAGSVITVGDWALLRIDGELTGGSGGGYTLLGWDSANLSRFAGYTIHHGSGLPQRRSSFDSIGLDYVARVVTNGNGGRSTVFLPCSGAGCSHFDLRFNQSISGGASGASILVDGDKPQVVGVLTNTNETCGGNASRFSKMYEDGRVQGALTYGDDYFRDRGEARSFDDSARPDYNPVPPAIEGDAEIVIGVVHGSNGLPLTLRAEAFDVRSLRWGLLEDSGPSVAGSGVRFLEDKGARARLVYEVPGGIKEQDQFSVQVSSAGGSDMVTVRVRLIGGPLPLPPECEGKGLATVPGNGTLGNPYQLSTLCQLQDINSQLDSHYRLTADIDASSSRDWNGGSGFHPVAKGVGIFQIFELLDGELALRSTYERTLSQYVFRGSFDGGGFSIDGLVVNREEEELVGLFSITDGATFRNVRLLNSEIKGRDGVGTLAGLMIRSTVSGFHFRGGVDGISDVGSLSGISFSGSFENGSVTGSVQGAEDFVGGLAGGHFGGTVSDVSAYGLTVSGRNYVGGLVGHDRNSTISDSNAHTEVSGDDFVGGLTGWSQGGTLGKCFVTGTANGFSVVGGLAGWVRGSDIIDSYATASASGTDNVGGLVGWSSNGGAISNSYATGAATGTTWVGSLVGDNQGEVRNSYASGVVTPVGNGQYVGGLLGDNSGGSSSDSFMRTLAQLQCPLRPGQSCRGARSYVGWSEREWDFGDANKLPTIRSQPAPVIAEGDEKVLVAAYGSSSVTLALHAESVNPDSLRWQLLSGSGSGVPGSSVRFLKDQGAEARIVYEVQGGIRKEDQFSVQVRGTGGTDVITVLVGVAPAIVGDDEKALSVAYGSGEGELTMRAGAVNPDSLRWRLVSGSGSSVPESRVRFLRNQGVEARVVYEVPGGIRQEDQFSIQVTGTGGTDVVVVRVVVVPTIVEGDEETLVVAYGSGGGELVLHAEAVNPDSLSWQLVSGSGPQEGNVRFTDQTGAEARVVYEVRGGIRQRDKFSVQVRDSGGSDEITIFVMPDRPPVINRVFGREVDDDDDELIVYISPQTLEVVLDVIASDESPENLEWTVTGDAGASLDIFPRSRVGGEVEVSYRRSSAEIKSGSFVTTVTDRFGQSDSFVVRIAENADAPEVVNDGVTITKTGKTLEVKIPYSSEQLVLDLVTRLARAGLVGEQVRSTPTDAQASFSSADGEGALKVLLPVPLGVDEASFLIRVRNGAASEKITIHVTREQVIRLRLKAYLGGATR